MDILQMHRDIEQTVQRLGFYLYDNLETEEVDIQINKQIDLFVESCVDKVKQLKKGNITAYKDTQVELDKIRTLVKLSESTFSVANGVLVTMNLPDDYYHLLAIDSSIKYKCIESGKEVEKTDIITVRVYAMEDFRDAMRNPLHKPDIESAIGFISSAVTASGNKIEVQPDTDYNITKLSMVYLRKPATVLYNKDVNGNYQSAGSIHCDLPINVHNIICDNTSKRIMAVIEANQQKIANIERETN